MANQLRGRLRLRRIAAGDRRLLRRQVERGNDAACIPLSMNAINRAIAVRSVARECMSFESHVTGPARASLLWSHLDRAHPV